MVQFAEIAYAPLLFQRPSEVRAIAELSNAERQALLPVFRVRPWMSSKQLEKSLATLRKAMDGLPFACDIDAWWSGTGKERESTAAFREMREDVTGLLWYEFIRTYEEAIPCIKLDTSIDNILSEIRCDWMIERGFGIVVTEKNREHIHKLPTILAAINHSNFFVIVDGGWSRDPLLNMANTTAIVSTVLDERDTTALFISSSSFPDQFGEIGINDTINLKELDFFDEVRAFVAQAYNRSTVRYSDWATTRPPPSIPIPARWVPRIDIPERQQIRIFRSRIDTEAAEDVRDTCIRLARVAVADQSWPSPPPSWGHYLVDLTASESEFGIYSPQRNTATRINMHLHQRLSALVQRGVTFGEEPFDD